MTPYAKATDQYLVQRVMGASPLQLIILLLEGGQRFLGQAAQALQRQDYALKARKTNTVLSIIDELNQRLDHEHGGELAANLAAIYTWWTQEILTASSTKNPAQMERVIAQMGELRQAWEQLERQGSGDPSIPGFQLQDMVG